MAVEQVVKAAGSGATLLGLNSSSVPSLLSEGRSLWSATVLQLALFTDCVCLGDLLMWFYPVSGHSL